MNLRILINGSYDISEMVSSAELSGDTAKFNRQLNVNAIVTKDGRTPQFRIIEGSRISLRIDNKLLFVGVIFSHEVNSEGNVSLTAYDSNVYLTKSNDSRIFKNKKASEIITMLAKDFGIKTGKIADTGYVIPYLRMSNKTLFDMVVTALKLTSSQTGKRFFIGNDGGNLTLKEGAKSDTKYVFKDGANLISASFKSSIEDTITQVKVIGGAKGKEISVVAKNEKLRQKFGVMQALETMDEKATASQIKQRADALMKQKGVIDEQYQVEVLGIPEVDVGTPVYIKNVMTGIYGAFYVTSVKHTYAENHLMSLELSRTYDLPDIEISSDDLKPEEVKAKGSKKKKTSKKALEAEKKKEATKQ